MKKLTYQEFKKRTQDNNLEALIDEQWWQENYKNLGTKIPVRCEKHGKFYQAVSSYLKNTKCKKCHDESNRTDWRTRLSNYTNENIKFLSTKYNIPQKLYIEVPCIKCRTLMKKSIFMYYYENDNICIECKKKESGSSYERIVLEYLNSKNIEHILEYFVIYKSQKLFFDFCIPKKNIMIEVDGEQHFKPIKYFGGSEGFRELKKRDFLKNRYCFENNIKLIRIPYFDIDNFQRYLNKYKN